MTPMQIWSNESQERYVLAIPEARIDEFGAICERKRCPFAVVGIARADGRLVVEDTLFANDPVDMPQEVLLGKPPRMHRDVKRLARTLPAFDASAIDLKDAAYRVLRLPSVADKTFLVTIGDRSVGGMCARDQMVGPWQVPVADCAVTTMGYATNLGEAMEDVSWMGVGIFSADAESAAVTGQTRQRDCMLDIHEPIYERLVS